MSAYLHVVLPVAFYKSKNIKRDDDLEPPEEFLPQEYANCFDFVSSERKVDEIVIGDYRRTRYSQDVSFQLKDDVFREIKAFIPEYWTAFSDIELNRSCQILNRKKMEKFVENDFANLDFSRDNLDFIDDDLGKLYGNYYLRFYNLNERCVYCGWPFAKNDNATTVIDCFSIMCYTDKLGLERDSENEFSDIAEEVKIMLGKKYKISELLFVVGY